MCGIIGVVGMEDLGKTLLGGIKNLEYRGYDSIGMSCVSGKKLITKKDIGRIEEVNKKLNFLGMSGTIGMAHCRWSTHGKVTKENAHPHSDCKGKISIVHNGIIENYSDLKERLESSGHKFKSQTDSEIIAHLIEDFYEGNLEKATLKTLKLIEGSYALAIISSYEPDKLIAARNESPLIIGVGKNFNLIASDVPAILEFTNKVIYLEDKEIAILTKSSVKVLDLNNGVKTKKINLIHWNKESAQKSGYKHFMLKEIFEQPRCIESTIFGRIQDERINMKDEIGLSEQQIQKINRIVMLACGTSWHAALVGEFMMEELAKIPTEVEYASEFRYRNPIIKDGTLVIGISQSGETADTIAAIKEAKKRGAKVLSICNTKGSSITRISDSVLYTNAGLEIGVASTKAFTSQLTVLYLLTIYFSKARNSLNQKQLKNMMNGIRKIPLQIDSVLNKSKEIEKIAELFYKKRNALYLGRGVNFPIALEGALKLKEVSYIHSEGYPAAEMKHGPIALIDKDMPIIFVAPYDVYTYKKILGNIEEVKARGGIVIAIATENDKEISKKADYVFYIPDTLYTLSSILSVIPLQLLAYYIADKLGRDVDKPRSLAKSVTVE